MEEVWKLCNPMVDNSTQTIESDEVKELKHHIEELKATLKNQINYSMYDEQCFRCGRTGHWESQCHAKTDIHGESLGY